MKTVLNKFTFIVIVLVLATCTSAWAAKAAESRKKARPTPRLVMFQESMIQRIIKSTSRNVSRRYNLTPEQAKIADDMLESNSKVFLAKHIEKIRVLFPKMFEMRLSDKDPSVGEVQAFAKDFYPIVAEAVALIKSENKKFHNILDEKQKKKHQADLDKMDRDVGMLSERLQRWSKGGYKANEFREGGVMGKPRNRPRPKRERVDQDYGDETSFTYWDLYVQLFIEAWQLNKGQQTMAYSVLSKVKSKGMAYQKGPGKELEAAKLELKRMERAVPSTKPADKKAKVDLRKKVENLSKPLLDLYAELQSELLKIPTDQQRKAALELIDSETGETGKGNKDKKK